MYHVKEDAQSIGPNMTNGLCTRWSFTYSVWKLDISAQPYVSRNGK